MIRVGMLGADSSHTETYIGLMNPAGSAFHGAARVVKLWGADPAQAADKAGDSIEVLLTPEDAVRDVDLVMVCSRWGSDHYGLAATALEAGCPVYVDKPFTNNLSEAVDLLERARSRGIPLFSCSPFRFAPDVVAMRAAVAGGGAVRSGACTGLSEWADFGPPGRAIYFYGVHPAEILHAVFGPGYERVYVASSAGADVVTVRCANGLHLGLHLLRDCPETYQVMFAGEHGSGETAVGTAGIYEALLEQALAMVTTGKAPIPAEYAVEIVALLDAIDRGRTTETERWVPLAWRNPIGD